MSKYIVVSQLDADGVFDGLAGLSSNSGLYQIVGGVTVVGALDKIRLTTAGGDTFDAGQVNVTWE